MILHLFFKIFLVCTILLNIASQSVFSKEIKYTKLDSILTEYDTYLKDFIKESAQNKSGKNVGLRSIWFNGKRKDKTTGEYKEHIHERFRKYIAEDFSRFK